MIKLWLILATGRVIAWLTISPSMFARLLNPDRRGTTPTANGYAQGPADDRVRSSIDCRTTALFRLTVLPVRIQPNHTRRGRGARTPSICDRLLPPHNLQARSGADALESSPSVSSALRGSRHLGLLTAHIAGCCSRRHRRLAC